MYFCSQSIAEALKLCCWCQCYLCHCQPAWQKEFWMFLSSSNLFPHCNMLKGNTDLLHTVFLKNIWKSCYNYIFWLWELFTGKKKKNKNWVKCKWIFLSFTIIFLIYLKHFKFCLVRILQVPAAYCPIDPDAPPLLSTYFMRKSNLQYILVENDKIKVSVQAYRKSIEAQFRNV